MAQKSKCGFICCFFQFVCTFCFRIVITFNVNHTLDSGPPDFNAEGNEQEIGELKSKPEFRVNLTKGGTTLSLQCSFLNPEDQEEGYSKWIFFIC